MCKEGKSLCALVVPVGDCAVHVLQHIWRKTRRGRVLMALHRELKRIGLSTFPVIGLGFSFTRSQRLSLFLSHVGFEILLVIMMFWKRTTKGKSIVHRQQPAVAKQTLTMKCTHWLPVFGATTETQNEVSPITGVGVLGFVCAAFKCLQKNIYSFFLCKSVFPERTLRSVFSLIHTVGCLDSTWKCNVDQKGYTNR